MCWCSEELWEEPSGLPGSHSACSVTSLLQGGCWAPAGAKEKIAAVWVPITFSGGFNAFSNLKQQKLAPGGGSV